MELVLLEGNTVGKDIDLSIFEKLGKVTIYELSNAENAPKRIENADIVIVNKVPMNEKTLGNAKNLKMIAVTATGTNIVDKAYTDSRGITVANVGGYSTDSVAQLTFALALHLVHKLPYYDSYVKSGAYVKSDIFCNFDMPFVELAGKTWGIIGLGAIGKRVAGLAEAFGCRVIYYSTSGKNANADYEQVDFNTILRESDILSIHAPLTPDTEGLMNLDAFRKMKKESIFINMGRGPIVNEADLLRALKEDLIGGAGLDVLSVEPMTADNPLLQFKDSNRLLITPHVAWATTEARNRLVQETWLNVEAFLKGEKRNVV